MYINKIYECIKNKQKSWYHKKKKKTMKAEYEWVHFCFADINFTDILDQVLLFLIINTRTTRKSVLINNLFNYW